MTGPTTDQAKTIGTKALAWAAAAATDVNNQAAAGAAATRANTLRNYINANFNTMGLAEYNQRVGEYSQAVQAQHDTATAALNSAQGMQDAYDDMQGYIKSIVQSAVPEKP